MLGTMRPDCGGGTGITRGTDIAARVSADDSRRSEAERVGPRVLGVHQTNLKAGLTGLGEGLDAVWPAAQQPATAPPRGGTPGRTL